MLGRERHYLVAAARRRREVLRLDADSILLKRKLRPWPCGGIGGEEGEESNI